MEASQPVRRRLAPARNGSAPAAGSHTDWRELQVVEDEPAEQLSSGSPVRMWVHR